VIDRDCSDRKYVEMFTHRVGSEGASSRRTVFIRRTDPEQWEVPKIIIMMMMMMMMIIIIIINIFIFTTFCMLALWVVNCVG
jgi:hypothetical protein